MLPFECAAGTVPGTDHTKPGQPLSKNNQDAFSFGGREHLIVGVVCDGCSGGGSGGASSNEVGAKIGSRLVARALVGSGHLLVDNKGTPYKPAWDRVEREATSHIQVLASAMTGDESFSNIIANMFLFTVIGFVITPTHTALFSIGDGKLFVNGEDVSPDHFVAPPYIAYQLTGSRLFDDAGELLHFEVKTFPTSEINSILVGSDGLDDLLENAETQLVGKVPHIGPISQFWEQDKFFKNTDTVRRRLALINQEFVNQGSIAYGPLRDDTTLIVARRKREEDGENNL